jgi:HlyD family secretion protein
MKPATRWTFGGGALLVALVVWGLWPAPVMVDVAEVARGALLVTIDDEGETRVRDRYVVSASVPGRVLRVEIEPGDVVNAGDVVATLQPAPPPLLDLRARAQADARIAAARAGLERAVATCDQARTESASADQELQRHRELDAARLLARDRLDAVETLATVKAGALRAAEAGVRSAREELNTARAALVLDTGAASRGAVVMRAPVSGTVLRRLRESESAVPAGEPLVEIGDTARLEIVSDLLSTEAVKVRPGQPVLVEGWGGDMPLRGVVRRVEPAGFTKVSALGVEEQRVNVIVDLVDHQAPAARLGDGYRVEVRIVVSERADVVKIPVSSLYRLGDEWRAFVVEQGKAVERTLRLGERNSLDAEVLSGVTAGDRVIVHPPDSVRPGTAVKPRS